MKYTILLNEYKQALHNACASYEELFTSKEQLVPLHRAQDIINLKALWQQEDDPKKIKGLTINLCRKFYTGWLRRSKLRTRILSILNSPIYSDDSFFYALLEENHQLHLQNASVVGNVAPGLERMTGPVDLPMQIKVLSYENQQLREEKTKLKEQVTHLTQQTDGLQKANQKLTVQTKNSQTPEARLEYKRSTPDSPGIMSESGLRTLLKQPF